ncbi:helix-turn-helix domain-containing protein [Yokenella regensburgei]|uniref:helix-turn-helix domain-containing protein n=1 Tax=Yokenella regensburgei TaxID=158877 RepID=UPI003EDB0F19
MNLTAEDGFEGLDLDSDTALLNISSLLSAIRVLDLSESRKLKSIKNELLEISFEYAESACEALVLTSHRDQPLYRPCDGGLPLGGRIQLARENLDLTEAELAIKLNTYSDHISDWECGITEPPARMVIPLANALKCDLLWLLAGEPVATADEA